MGVPAIVGGGGIERIVEIPLSEEERAMLARSAKSVQAVVDLCKAGTSAPSPQQGHEKG